MTRMGGWSTKRGLDCQRGLRTYIEKIGSVHWTSIESCGLAIRPIAVLVQQMVEAKVSGVAFSANPLTGKTP